MKMIPSFLVLTSLFVSPLAAQYRTGTIPVGGSIYASTSQYADGKTWSLRFAPSVSYYYKDHAAFGITSSFGFTDYDFEYNDSIKSRSRSSDFGISPFVRFNHSVVEKFGFSLILSGDLEIDKFRYNRDGDGSDISTTRYVDLGFSSELGLYYFPLENLSIETGIGLLRYYFRSEYRDGHLFRESHNGSLSLSTSTAYLSLFYCINTKANGE